jgi:hypothetical protein
MMGTGFAATSAIDRERIHQKELSRLRWNVAFREARTEVQDRQGGAHGLGDYLAVPVTPSKR